TEGITVMPVAGGLVGANKLANAGLGRGAQPLTTTDDSTQMEREKVRVKRDAQPASQIVEQISEKSAKIEQLQQEVKSLEEKIQGIMRVRILYRKEESLAEARSHHDAKSREIDQLRKEISILEQAEGTALKRKMQSLAQLNQPVINPQQRINERVAEMIEEYNRKHSDSKPLTPNTPVIVILEPYKTLHSQSGTTDITRSFAETFTLQEITTGEYLYKLNEITKHNLSNYQITFNQHNDYIASVDRNALESGLRKEVDDYFSDPTKANEFSGALESVIKHRVIAYLDEHCKDDIFRQRLVDFYEGKAAADEVFINDKKVPGVLAFKIGEGVNAQTLVMSIYTKDSFVFKTKEVSILRHHPKGSYSVPVKIEALEPSSDQKVFNRVISNALSFYEQLRYIGKANPFEYKKINNFEISAPISFGHGEKIGCLPGKMMRDIQEKTKENYDTSIYTKSEEKKDVIIATFRKVASAASVSLTLIPGPKSAVARTVLFFVSLGIDALSTVGAYVQAEQADRPEKHDSLMRDAIYETILFGLGNVGDSAEAALKGYRAIKSKNIMNILKKVDVVDDVTDVTVESATASLRIVDKTKTAPTLYAQASQVTGTVAEKHNASDERKDISFDLDSNTMIIRFDGGDNNRKSMTDAEMVRYISRALEDRGLERGIIKSISIQSDYPIMVNESYGGQIVANQLGIPLILWQPSPTKEGAYMQKVFEPS
ncbi:hypothetical protein, partial [Serratia marcescens]|uniref:hypothetical protein n=1 Tax=Serratia marcescens TaxID=615 RepID=UPI00237EFD14